MNLKCLELLISAEYDKQRLDHARTLEQLSNAEYQRYCRHSAFVAQAVIEQKCPSYRQGIGGVDWYYTRWYKSPTIELDKDILS